MNPLDLALNEYIAIRRALGFELREVTGCLRNFVAFLKIEGSSYITKELALRWATQPADVQPYGPGVWVWFGVSPPGTVRRSRQQRSRRPDFSFIGINE